MPIRTGPRSDRKPTPDDAAVCSTLTGSRLGLRRQSPSGGSAVNLEVRATWRRAGVETFDGDVVGAVRDRYAQARDLTVAKQGA
jgi:hypothetical protein